MDKATILKFKSYSLKAIGEHYGFHFDKVGDKWRALCLFHNDTGTPNLFVYPDDSFFCFACKRGGPKSSFIAAAEHVNAAVIEKMWGNSDPLDEVVAVNLTQRAANFKPHFQLFLAKLTYGHLGTGQLSMADLKYYDDIIARSKSLTMEQYADLVNQLTLKYGGHNGHTHDAGSV